MTAIFISHRSSDNAEAQALKDWLGEQGHERLFLDSDPADGLAAGVEWELLYQELWRCQASLIVLTPAWSPNGSGTSSASPARRARRSSASASSRASAVR